MKEDEQPKGAVYLDGVTTRNLIDLHRQYKRENIRKSIFGDTQESEKETKEGSDVVCSECKRQIPEDEGLWVCADCDKVLCVCCVDTTKPWEEGWVCSDCRAKKRRVIKPSINDNKKQVHDKKL